MGGEMLCEQKEESLRQKLSSSNLGKANPKNKILLWGHSSSASHALVATAHFGKSLQTLRDSYQEKQKKICEIYEKKKDKLDEAEKINYIQCLDNKVEENGEELEKKNSLVLKSSLVTEDNTKDSFPIQFEKKYE